MVSLFGSARSNLLPRLFGWAGLFVLVAGQGQALAQRPLLKPPTAPLEVRVLGLFSPDRVQDLHELLRDAPSVKLHAVDYQTATAFIEYDPTSDLFRAAKPEQLIERMDTLIRTNTRGMFQVKPLSDIPQESLQRVQIDIVGLDCKACSLAVYEMVAKLDGVEQATASFKLGQVVAWIDPAKTSRAALETVLKQRNVQLREP